jgi:flagellar export protein FliJ
MNTSPQARPWALLVERAARDLEDARAALQAAQSRLAQLTATEQRLSLMLADYRERHRQQLQAGQLMGDQINSQRFIQQLQQLHTHAMREAHQCEAQCAQHQKTLVRMQLELDKMKKLAEQDDKRLHKLAEKVEARRLDEMAVMRFRFRQA